MRRCARPRGLQFPQTAAQVRTVLPGIVGRHGRRHEHLPRPVRGAVPQPRRRPPGADAADARRQPPLQRPRHLRRRQVRRLLRRRPRRLDRIRHPPGLRRRHRRQHRRHRRRLRLPRPEVRRHGEASLHHRHRPRHLPQEAAVARADGRFALVLRPAEARHRPRRDARTRRRPGVRPRGGPPAAHRHDEPRHEAPGRLGRERDRRRRPAGQARADREDHPRVDVGAGAVPAGDVRRDGEPPALHGAARGRRRVERSVRCGWRT